MLARPQPVTARSSISGPLVLASTMSALAGLLFGYDNIVVSGAIHYLAVAFSLDSAGVGWAAGCALIGCLAGSAGAGAVVDRFGLRFGLAICAACFALSSACIWFSGSLAQFVAWRVVGGLGIGGASIVAPMYIAEVAPPRVRGRLVTLYQLGIVLGILTAVTVNMFIQAAGDEPWNVASGWRWMFAAGLVPAVLFACIIGPSVESPRWLMKTGRHVRALRVLESLHGAERGAADAVEIRNTLAADAGGFPDVLKRRLRRPLLIGVALAALSQASGITPLFSFLPEVFKAAGSATSDAFRQSVLVGAVNGAATLVALWLVDIAGRKTLILAGTLVQCLSFAIVAWLFRTSSGSPAILLCVMAFVAAHAVGNGAVCWVIISEIFPTRLRGRAMSVATTALWVVAYFGNQCFPLMRRHLGFDGTFACFSGAALVNLLVVAVLVPETRGRSLEQIEWLWRQSGARKELSQ